MNALRRTLVGLTTMLCLTTVVAGMEKREPKSMQQTYGEMFEVKDVPNRFIVSSPVACAHLEDLAYAGAVTGKHGREHVTLPGSEGTICVAESSEHIIHDVMEQFPAAQVTQDYAFQAIPRIVPQKNLQPLDPEKLWGLQTLNVPHPVYRGQSIRVYVADTGIKGTLHILDDTSDFCHDPRERARGHPEFLDDYGNSRVAVGANFVTGTDNRFENILCGNVDVNGHGTHVAATIAGRNVGVLPEAELVPVRVLNIRGSSVGSSVLEGIYWIINDHVQRGGGFAVANFSLGGPRSEEMNRAMSDLRKVGIVPVVAAGNEDARACNVSPASALHALTVGAFMENGQRAPFSNYDSCVNIWAPGYDILSASLITDDPDRAYVLFNGTSMATPHVAGLVGIYGQRVRDRHQRIPALQHANIARFIHGMLLHAAHRTENEITYDPTLPWPAEPGVEFRLDIPTSDLSLIAGFRGNPSMLLKQQSPPIVSGVTNGGFSYIDILLESGPASAYTRETTRGTRSTIIPHQFGVYTVPENNPYEPCGWGTLLAEVHNNIPGTPLVFRDGRQRIFFDPGTTPPDKLCVLSGMSGGRARYFSVH